MPFVSRAVLQCGEFGAENKENSDPNAALVVLLCKRPRFHTVLMKTERSILMNAAKTAKKKSFLEFVEANTGVADRTRDSAVAVIAPNQLELPDRLNHLISDDLIAASIRLVLLLREERASGETV